MGNINVTVDGFGTYPVSRGLSDAEILRNLASLLGASWIASATICTNSDGSKRVTRPPAGAKGAGR